MSSLKSKYFQISFFLVLHCLFISLQGCHQNELKKDAVQLAERPAPNRLMQSILDEFSDQKIAIYLRDDDKLLVVSDFKLIGTEVRQRYIAKVMKSPRGLFFKIRSIYERLDRRQTPPIWVDAKGEVTLKKAYYEEQKLGLAIRARFN